MCSGDAPAFSRGATAAMRPPSIAQCSAWGNLASSVRHASLPTSAASVKRSNSARSTLSGSGFFGSAAANSLALMYGSTCHKSSPAGSAPGSGTSAVACVGFGLGGGFCLSECLACAASSTVASLLKPASCATLCAGVAMKGGPHSTSAPQSLSINSTSASCPHSVASSSSAPRASLHSGRRRAARRTSPACTQNATGEGSRHSLWSNARFRLAACPAASRSTGWQEEQRSEVSSPPQLQQRSAPALLSGTGPAR